MQCIVCGAVPAGRPGSAGPIACALGCSCSSASMIFSPSVFVACLQQRAPCCRCCGRFVLLLAPVCCAAVFCFFFAAALMPFGRTCQHIFERGALLCCPGVYTPPARLQLQCGAGRRFRLQATKPPATRRLAVAVGLQGPMPCMCLACMHA